MSKFWGTCHKVVHCGNLACSSGNTTTALVTTNDVGQYSSIAILPKGVPFITFYDNTAGDLRYQICDDILCTTAPGGTSVEATNNIGKYISVAVGLSGFPIISYYDVTNADLRVAECISNSRNDDTCSTNTGSVKTSLDTTGDVGQYTSVAIEPDGMPFIAYYDVTNGDLKTVKCALPDCSQTTGGGFNNTGSDVGSIGLFFRNIYAAQYWGKKFQIANFDIAEEYLDEKGNLEPGDLVSLTGNSSLGVEKSLASSSYPIIGIVSTNPAIVLGDWSTNDKPPNVKPVALQGRVPVKISDENGPIKVGDRLTLSKTLPGHTMKQTEPGQSIGIALENGGSGKVLVFVNLSYWAPNVQQLTIDNLQLTTASESSSTTEFTGLFGQIINMFKKIGVVFENGIVRVQKLVANLIQTGELEVGSQDKPTGITIYDKITGQPVCIVSENNVIKSIPGKCAAEDKKPETGSVPLTNSGQENLPTPTPESTPESSATPEVSESPISEPTPSPTPSPEPTPSVLTTPEPSLTPTSTEPPTPEPVPEVIPGVTLLPAEFPAE